MTIRNHSFIFQTEIQYPIPIVSYTHPYSHFGKSVMLSINVTGIFQRRSGNSDKK